MFHQRLQALIDKKKVPPAEVARSLGMSSARTSEWLSGKTKMPRRKTLIALSNYFECDLDWLSTGEGTPYPDVKRERPAAICGGPLPVREIPVISYAEAGKWMSIWENYKPGKDGETILSASDLGPRPYSVKVVGPFMAPEFREGDYLTIDPDHQADSGDYVLARHIGQKPIFRKYYQEAGRGFLVTLDGDWGRPIEITENEWSILGRVMEKVKKY
ncbi:helix-turn-helix transcriptional regulator [Desulforhopalus vacuolatus]|uniref:LexA family protein n=1 Tax=Desulforhopalus vacuolatus TaxID=40414 RepID=UPI001966CDF7|nr:LexA family transcriptional regulator [Desulforhopalus vacuolatus]MBM9520874.1 helix-turn-helix transcriptional regulator [Desulforhopalus vacuolatus]